MTKSKIKENILIRQMFLSKSQQKAHTLTPMMQKILLNFFFKKASTNDALTKLHQSRAKFCARR